MTTSAMNLFQMLSIAAEAEDPSTKFLYAIASHLGIESDDAGAQICALLQKNISRIETDIEGLPLDEAMKGNLKRHLAPFNGIKNLSQVHMDIKSAKSHFLKPENMVGLTNLHLKLSGQVERPALGNDAKELAEKFIGVRNELLQANLPESLREVFFKRTSQIASILEHYYAFGPKKLEEELEGLVGALVVSAPENKSKETTLYKKLSKLAVAGLVILTAVDNGFGQVVSITKNATKLLELVDGDSDQADSEQ